jgi:hypothetical protein
MKGQQHKNRFSVKSHFVKSFAAFLTEDVLFVATLVQDFTDSADIYLSISYNVSDIIHNSLKPSKYSPDSADCLQKAGMSSIFMATEDKKCCLMILKKCQNYTEYRIKP